MAAVLYYYPACGRANQLRLALAEAGIAWKDEYPAGFPPTPEEVARGDYLLDHSIITITLALALALALALTLTLTLTLTPTLTLTLTRWHVATTC